MSDHLLHAGEKFSNLERFRDQLVVEGPTMCRDGLDNWLGKVTQEMIANWTVDSKTLMDWFRQAWCARVRRMFFNVN
eukprot:6485057-Amphidinium_carterae.1